MFRNKKFLFVESILFILLVVFAFKIGWRETYASLNQLTGLGTGSWVKIDVTSDGGTIVIVNSSGDTGKVSSNSGSSVTITGPSRNWADVYEAGGNFIAVSNSTGDYVHTFDGNSWNEITTGPMGPFNSAAMSDDQNYKVVTRGGSDYYDYYYSNNWSSGTLSDNWQDSAMSSNGQYTLLGSASGAYVNSEFSPGNVTVRLSSISITKVAMSDDGQHMLALASGGTAYYSVDYGANWSALPNKTGLQGVDVSNAGVIVAIKYSGGIYYTKDYGVNWLTIDDGTKSWLDVKINDQGTVVYAVVTGGYVYKHDIDNTPPFLSEGGPTGNLGDGELSTTLQVTTNESATCKYSTTSGTEYSSMEGIFDTENGTSHTEAISGLSPSTSYTYYVKCIDQSGNINAEDYSISFSTVADSSAPTITSVSSDKSDGTYTVGEVIDIDVTFSEAVTSTGDVTVTLETGDTDQACTFSVSNSDTGTCNYTVQEGDISSDLTVSSISGTIEDQASNAMADFTPATNLSANKNIVIDTTAPSVSSPLPSGAQAQGTTGVTLQVTTDENSTCKYGTTPDTAYASISNTFSTTGGTTHTQSITGLSANTSYTYYVRCTDSLSPTTSDTTISFSIPANPTTEESTEGSSGSGRTGRRNTSSSSSGSESNNAAVQIVDSVVKKTVEKIDSVLTEFKETIVGDPENKPKILELIDKLKEEFNKLFNRLEETQQSESSEENQNILFTQDLELGDSHPEVKLLQQFLNNNGYSVAPSGPGSKGQETEMFGYATRAALARFQRDNSIVPAVGNFGPITRDLINSLSN